LKKRALTFVALASILAIVAAACGKSTPEGGGQSAKPGTTFQKGGTAHVALLSDVTATMDPAKEYYSVAWTFLRVMNRTLLQYPALPAPDGNKTLPDVAAAQPEISADAMTWTFKLKPNVNFGPPINRPIVCDDFKAAFERMFTPAGAGGYNFYYTLIEGAADFKPGDDLSGVECQDDQTIIFHLTEPAGDFNFRVAMPATAPIPAAENVTKGHDEDYGRFMVSSGCYMWQGEDAVDFSGDAKSQKPAAGYQPNRSMTLVRNPSWQASTDSIRKCYLDEIDITIGGEPADLFNKVAAGTLDWIEDDPSDATSLQTFRADPNLQKQITPLYFTDSTYYLWMNLEVPPFDDIHVRKAVNWVINKDALLRIRGGPDFGKVATHIVAPSLTGALPESYDPYATPGHRGDATKAAEEMKQSKYDTDQDGQCDAPECKDVFHVTDSADPYPDLTASITDDLAKVGVTLRTRALDRGTMYNFYSTPAKHVAFGSGAGWGKDYADALTFIDPLFNGDNIQPTGNVNYAMVNDPKIQTDLATCKAATGTERGTCWANIDKYLMENVVPWVPWRWGAHLTLYSNRIAHFGFNQFAGETAIDDTALTPTAISAG
jgi:peptide/nickel transport system substrate-binding protein